MIEVRLQKRETLLFDSWDGVQDFINQLAQDYSENIMIGAPKETHDDYIELSAVFYNPHEAKPQGQEVILLDIKMPK